MPTYDILRTATRLRVYASACNLRLSAKCSGRISPRSLRIPARDALSPESGGLTVRSERLGAG